MREYLKNARKKLGLTQEDVARKANISPNYYCDIENCNRQRQMKVSLLIELSTILKIPINDMLANETKLKSTQPTETQNEE